MIANRATRVQAASMQAVRAFGSHHAPPHDYKVDVSASKNTAFKHPSDHDMDYMLPKNGILNEKIH